MDEWGLTFELGPFERRQPFYERLLHTLERIYPFFERRPLTYEQI